MEYLLPPWGLLCYFTPGLDTRRRIITELRAMFRDSITEHRRTLDTNHPRYVVTALHAAQLLTQRLH